MPTIVHLLSKRLWRILRVIPIVLACIPPSHGGDELKSKPDYRIAPRDLLQFQIYEEPDTLIAQRVSATGEIPLPMVGVVHVSDLTLRDAENKLRDLYIEGGYFVNPQVILLVQQYNERTVSVLGQVNNPLQVTLPLEAESLDIVEAITRAAGLTRLALGEGVQVRRVESNGREKRFTVNVEAYLAGIRGSDGLSSFRLLPGDVVFVPERKF